MNFLRALLALLVLIPSINTLARSKRSLPLFNGRSYSNIINERGMLHLTDAANIFVETKLAVANGEQYLPETLDVWKAYEKPIELSDTPSIQWIGHASFLIQIGGINILTDPFFYDLSFLYSRNLPAGIAPENLPKIDIVLISHNHRDHMDEQSLLLLKKYDPTIIVPKGIGAWFKKNNFIKVIEHNWWDKTDILGLSITCVPAHHWCGRGAFDLNRALWSGWMINWKNQTKDKTLYFAGDTSYCKQYFDEIVDEFPNIDIALLPIGPCESRKLMKHSHVDAKEAVKIFKRINAKEFIPMHWGTFRLGTDSFDAPITKLKEQWSKENLDSNNLHILKFGERITFSK